jgi:D-alanyl-D-alanine carboxypeptidase
MYALIIAVAIATASLDYSSLMTALHAPGLQIVVVDNGKVLQNRAFGVKNVGTQAPVDAHTRFEIGSITKQFTAAAILQLQERGKLSLDDELGKYVPAYTQGRAVTLRQMLLHTSGIPDYTETGAFQALVQKRGNTFVLARRGTPEAVLSLIQNKALDFTPGTKWAYSNTDYYLLGWVVEIASGEPWSSYIKANIFKPADMLDSTFMENETHVANMATGYTVNGGKISATGSMEGWAGASGAIVSTASDLAKWDDALLAGKIISRADLRVMTTPGPFRAVGAGYYAFGWVVDTFDGQPRIWHNGGTLGFGASNQIYPQSGQAVIVLTNISGGSGADKIADQTFEALHPEMAAANQQAVEGEDAAVTARAKSVWAQLASGTKDASQFNDTVNQKLTSEVLAGAKRQFAALGPATSWIYRGKKEAAGTTTYTYRVSFASGTVLNVSMSVDKDGKIASYLALPN